MAKSEKLPIKTDAPEPYTKMWVTEIRGFSSQVTKVDSLCYLLDDQPMGFEATVFLMSFRSL